MALPSTVINIYCDFWVIPRHLIYICRRFWTLSVPSSKAGVKFTPAFEDGTDRVFRNVCIYKSDAGESPKRKQTTFWTRRKLEIKNILWQLHVWVLRYCRKFRLGGVCRDAGPRRLRNFENFPRVIRVDAFVFHRCVHRGHCTSVI